MTDLEMTKLCAGAMGLQHDDLVGYYHANDEHMAYPWNPLHDDAQAMALVKRFRLVILADHADHEDKWSVSFNWEYPGAINSDLNRAIVECVAKMQAAKK